MNKITKTHVNNVIHTVDYVIQGTLTICTLTLKNGFKVVGTSGCADPDNFDVEIGRSLARQKAEDRVWELEGYLLMQRLYDQEQKETARLADQRKRKELTFSQALDWLKFGKRLHRTEWPMPVWVCLGQGHKNLPANGFWNAHTRKHAEGSGGTAEVRPYFLLRTSDGSVQMGWTPTQTDLLAEDWEVVE